MTRDMIYSVALFAGGAIYYNCIMPLIDTICNFLISFLNTVMHGWQMKIEMDEAETKAAVEVIQPAPKNGAGAIGFQVPDTTPYEDEIYDKRKNAK